MLLLMIEKGIQIDKIICVDTTKEFPQMYNHIEKVKRMIYPYEIEVVKIDFDYWMSEHIKTRGKNKGKVGYGWPDFRNRWCTALKQEAFKKSVYSDDIYSPRIRGNGKKIHFNIVEYHGIAADEKDRFNKNKDGRNIKMPLVDWNITEEQALEYCYNKGFNWGGLYEKMARVSCWCCPLSRIGELKTLYCEFPDLWIKLMKMDKLSYRKFRSDYSVDQLEDRFKYKCLYGK